MTASCVSAQELYDYSVGQLAEPRRGEVETHVLACDACARRLAGDGPFDDAIREAVDNVIPAAVLGRLKRFGETIAQEAEGRGAS